MLQFLSCLTCNSGYYAYGNYCVIAFPYNTYQDSSLQACVFCNEACLTCFGNQTDQCLSCHTSFFLQNNICEICHASCQTCGGPFNMNCLSCFSGTYLSSSYDCLTCDTSCSNCSGPSISQCLSDIVVCPINYYEDAVENVCASCDALCYSCNGPFSNNCTSCVDGLYFSNGSCVFVCSLDQYLNI